MISDSIFLVFALLFFADFAVTAFVFLFGRPKFLIPPYLRQGAGAVHGWAAARRNNNQSGG